MAEQVQLNESEVQSLHDILKEVEHAVELERTAVNSAHHSIKDLRWQFDQVSAKMNQAIYNEEHDKIHKACLETVRVLIEILRRS